jgi:DNA-binding NarL/FixJ family response regulator
VTRLLVASASPIVRAGLRALLAAESRIEVVGEVRPEELLAQTVALSPDVALLDLPVGNPDALEILWQLTTELPRLGVVVLSADPAEGRAREALSAGARGYLLRDASAEEIVAAIEAARLGLIVLYPATTRALLAGAGSRAQLELAEPLSPRELEVLHLLAQGLPSKTIAQRLKISEHTVKFHVGQILGKLGAASRTEAVALALRRGLIAV